MEAPTGCGCGRPLDHSQRRIGWAPSDGTRHGHERGGRILSPPQRAWKGWMPRAIDACTCRPMDWSWRRSSFWFVMTSERVVLAPRGTRPGTGPGGFPLTIFPLRSTMHPYAFTTTYERIFVG